MSAAISAFAVCQARRTPHRRRTSRIRWVSRAMAAICSAPRRFLRRSTEPKMTRDVSWESSCHQSPDSADQHRSQKHRIYSFLGSWVGELRYCFTWEMAQSQHKDDVSCRKKRFCSDFWTRFALHGQNHHCTSNFSHKKVKVDGFRRLIKTLKTKTKLFTLALIAEIHEQLICLSANSCLL